MQVSRRRFTALMGTSLVVPATALFTTSSARAISRAIGAL
jgi:hypothetical protein